MNFPATRSFTLVYATALLLFCLPFAAAQQAGYDLLQTAPGASVDLSSIPGMLPAKVPLKGVPICNCTANTDTIIHRTEDVSPEGGTVPLQMVALFLKNSAPVRFSGRAVDVYITVNHSNGVIGQAVLPQPDSLPVSTGSLIVHPHTFDSSITVHADVIIVAAGADVRNPATHLAHQAAPAVTLSSKNNVWSKMPPAGYPSACFFPANGFYPTGGVTESAPTHSHPVAPSGPAFNKNGRCISLDPATVTASEVEGQWEVISGGQALFDFDTRMADAQRTVGAIQNYHMTRACAVGSNLPGEQSPPFQYELVENTAPGGSLPGEDCVGLDLAKVTDDGKGGHWTITDGSQLMFDFGPQDTPAAQGVTIIKQFAFTSLCFVGRPDTDGRYVFTYRKAGQPAPPPKAPSKTVELKKLPASE
jgi:hypothetical protein